MPTNIEIKARAPEFEALKTRAEQLSDSPVQTITQTDTFFFAAKGRLKLREFGAGFGQLIYYERADQEGPKRSDYYVSETQDSEHLRSVLALALGVRGTVRKVRYLYMIGQTRVHLDDVQDLGHFVELEVVLEPGQGEAQGQAIAHGLMAALGVDSGDLLENAYIDLLERAPQ